MTATTNEVAYWTQTTYSLDDLHNQQSPLLPEYTILDAAILQRRIGWLKQMVVSHVWSKDDIVRRTVELRQVVTLAGLTDTYASALQSPASDAVVSSLIDECNQSATADTQTLKKLLALFVPFSSMACGAVLKYPNLLDVATVQQVFLPLSLRTYRLLQLIQNNPDERWKAVLQKYRISLVDTDIHIGLVETVIRHDNPSLALKLIEHEPSILKHTKYNLLCLCMASYSIQCLLAIGQQYPFLWLEPSILFPTKLEQDLLLKSTDSETNTAGEWLIKSWTTLVSPSALSTPAIAQWKTRILEVASFVHEQHALPGSENEYIHQALMFAITNKIEDLLTSIMMLKPGIMQDSMSSAMKVRLCGPNNKLKVREEEVRTFADVERSMDVLKQEAMQEAAPYLPTMANTSNNTTAPSPVIPTNMPVRINRALDRGDDDDDDDVRMTTRMSGSSMSFEPRFDRSRRTLDDDDVVMMTNVDTGMELPQKKELDDDIVYNNQYAPPLPPGIL